MLFISNQAVAFPLPQYQMSQVELPSTFTNDYDFEGIVALSNCSGSLVRFKQSLSTDKAWILTNGHCHEGFVRPGLAIYKKPSSRYFTLLNSKAQAMGRVYASELTYATMTGTDMALYRLRESYDEIRAQFAVNPLTIEPGAPQLSEEIEIISGYWKRGFTCSIENFIFELREDKWTFADSIRYSRPGCETIGGTSGAPILKKGTRTVVGVNNTGNESGWKCTMNNPCEVDQYGQITFVKGYSYGQQTYWIYSCLNFERDIDLNLVGCQLPSKTQFVQGPLL